MNAFEAIVVIGAGWLGFFAALAVVSAIAASITSREIEEFHARRELARAQEAEHALDLGVAAEAEAILAEEVSL